MLFPERKQIEPIQHLLNALVREPFHSQPALSPYAVGKELMVHILHDAVGNPLPLLRAKDATVEADRSGTLPHQATQTAGKGAFSHTIVTRDGQHLSRAGGEGKVLKYRRLPLVPAAQTLHRQSIPSPRSTGGRQSHLSGRECAKAQSDPFCLSQPPEFCSAPDPLHDPVPQIDGPIYEIRQKVQPMLRNENGVSPTFQVYDLIMESVNGIPIQIGRRFIQNVEFRPHGIDRGKGQQLLFSARHGKDVPAPQPLQM